MFWDLLSYPRSLLAALVYPFMLVAYSSLALLANLVFHSRKLDDKIIVSWAQNTCHLFGVDVQVEGLENIPPGGCLFLFNHGSFFDIFAMSGWLPGNRFGAKIELFKIPVFGLAMARLGVLPIARDKKEEVFRVYEAAQIRIKAGERFSLSPEGTRQIVEKLGPFKAGPFVFAINAKAPVVPVVIRNAVLILPKGKYIPNMGTWHRTVRMTVLPAIPTENLNVDDRPRLQEQVRSVMAPYF
jgi:1-acyl-sn-glycerol-3-phosphate acyltransferase